MALIRHPVSPSQPAVPSKRWMQRAVFAAALLIACPGTASAQWIEFLEWLDRLSGPGPFISHFPPVRVPLFCVTEVTETVTRLNDGSLHALELLPQDRRQRLELLPQCLGIVPYIRRPNPVEPNQPIVSKKERTLSVEFKFAKLHGQDNNLQGYPPELTKEQLQVNVVHLGLGARLFPHQSTHFLIAADRFRFTSNEDLFPPDRALFEPFVRHGLTLEVGTRPLWRFGDHARAGVVALGVVFGMGRFQAADFGAVGPFNEVDNKKFYISIGFDPWWRVN